ncbi:MAG: D-xylose transport system substrate-binding protein, partial [Nocardioidaceae bacterium]|nr:D-xylose transport system substrate-binding protein [Nocardioidaceae bacterium]
MRKTTATFATVSLAATFALAACGSNDSGGGSGGGSQTASKATGTCSLTSPPTSGAQAPPSTKLGKASGKVGVILPDTTSSTRYTLYDKPLLEKALTDAGIQADVQNAQGNKSTFASIAQNMIGAGTKVMLIDSIDAPSGAGVEQSAGKAGVKVIDYDRVNLGGTAPYYVSFDNEDVGKLQAQTLVDCLNSTGVTNPKIIMMDGGTDVDNNAVLFKKGAHEVLDPLQQAGKLKIVSEAVVKGWTVSNAAPAFSQALTAAGGQVDGVVAANDDIANAVIGVLKNQGLNGHVAVTGQDSGVEG